MNTQKTWRRRTRTQISILVLLVAVLAGGLYLLQQKSEAESRIEVTFKKTDGSLTSPLYLEVAKTEAQRETGLMFRKALAPDYGMIFIFPESSKHSFWMKNTYLSLDMLFLDEDRKVVGILPSVPPLNLEPRTVGLPSRYVVELGAGSSSRLGITIGATLTTTVPLPNAK